MEREKTEKHGTPQGEAVKCFTNKPLVKMRFTYLKKLFMQKRDVFTTQEHK